MLSMIVEGGVVIARHIVGAGVVSVNILNQLEPNKL
jgi:hypothetical protein